MSVPSPEGEPLPPPASTPEATVPLSPDQLKAQYLTALVQEQSIPTPDELQEGRSWLEHVKTGGTLTPDHRIITPDGSTTDMRVDDIARVEEYLQPESWLLSHTERAVLTPIVDGTTTLDDLPPYVAAALREQVVQLFPRLRPIDEDIARRQQARQREVNRTRNEDIPLIPTRPMLAELTPEEGKRVHESFVHTASRLLELDRQARGTEIVSGGAHERYVGYLATRAAEAAESTTLAQEESEIDRLFPGITAEDREQLLEVARARATEAAEAARQGTINEQAAKQDPLRKHPREAAYQVVEQPTYPGLRPHRDIYGVQGIRAHHHMPGRPHLPRTDVPYDRRIKAWDEAHTDERTAITTEIAELSKQLGDTDTHVDAKGAPLPSLITEAKNAHAVLSNPEYKLTRQQVKARKVAARYADQAAGRKGRRFWQLPGRKEMQTAMEDKAHADLGALQFAQQRRAALQDRLVQLDSERLHTMYAPITHRLLRELRRNLHDTSNSES